MERDHPLLSTSARNQKFFSCWFKGRCYIYLFSNHLVDTVYAPFRYEHQEIALNCGTMLRECARYEALAKILLYSEDFYNFFKFVEVSTFDIASDAFSTFKVTLRLYLVSASIIFSCKSRSTFSKKKFPFAVTEKFQKYFSVNVNNFAYCVTRDVIRFHEYLVSI